MIRRTTLAAMLAVLGSGAAHAELFGLLNGRSADPSDLPPLSVEAGIVTGDGYQNLGARVNYAVSPQLTVFGDFGLTEFGGGGFGEDPDGNSFGGGVFFHLAEQQFLPNYDVAAKFSYHISNLEVAGFEIDYNNISVEGLVSSAEPITAGGMKWYANAGINRLDADADGGFGESDTELLIGGGVYLPVGPGQVYGGIDLVDELTFGVGFRYFVQ